MLRIGQDLLGDLRRHGEEAYPAESCGVLLGRVAGGERRVTRAQRCGNAAPQPARRFAIDAVELLGAARLGRARGEEIVGFYHSHPDAPPEPSPADWLDGATWPGCAAVITRVAGGRAAETRCFVLEPGSDGTAPAFREEPVAGEGG